jgi:hypothetical protein
MGTPRLEVPVLSEVSASPADSELNSIGYLANGRARVRSVGLDR